MSIDGYIVIIAAILGIVVGYFMGMTISHKIDLEDQIPQRHKDFVNGLDNREVCLREQIRGASDVEVYFTLERRLYKLEQQIKGVNINEPS